MLRSKAVAEQGVSGVSPSCSCGISQRSRGAEGASILGEQQLLATSFDRGEEAGAGKSAEWADHSLGLAAVDWNVHHSQLRVQLLHVCQEEADVRDEDHRVATSELDGEAACVREERSVRKGQRRGRSRRRMSGRN